MGAGDNFLLGGPIARICFLLRAMVLLSVAEAVLLLAMLGVLIAL